MEVACCRICSHDPPPCGVNDPPSCVLTVSLPSMAAANKTMELGQCGEGTFHCTGRISGVHVAHGDSVLVPAAACTVWSRGQ